MRFNCSHTFVLEAADQDDFEKKLTRYSELVRKASERLDIGYGAGLVFGQPASGRPPITNDEDFPPDSGGNLERLFR